VLSSALALNSYEVGRKELRGVRLQESQRCAPLDYEPAVREISRWHREGRVVSVDLGKVEIRCAIRIVEFCSGLSAAKSGWIFRLSDDVIVLTPGAG
jgi:FtsZ-interacting cell division protein YlmF